MRRLRHTSHNATEVIANSSIINPLRCHKPRLNLDLQAIGSAKPIASGPYSFLIFFLYTGCKRHKTGSDRMEILQLQDSAAQVCCPTFEPRSAIAIVRREQARGSTQVIARETPKPAHLHLHTQDAPAESENTSRVTSDTSVHIRPSRFGRSPRSIAKSCRNTP